MNNTEYTKESMLDKWEVTGKNDKEALYETLKNLSDTTDIIQLNSDQIQLFTVRDITEDSINGYLHNRNGTMNISIPLSEMASVHGADAALLKETTKKSYLMFKLGSEYFFTTKHVLKTLSQRAGSAMGDFALRDEVKIRFPRDTGYVAYMSTVPSMCRVLYRKVDNAKKIYAVFTDRYKLLKQYPLVKQVIESFEAEMGASDLAYYRVDNFMTEIYLELPEKARDFQKVYSIPDEVVPGVYIRLSDVGDSSFSITGTTRFNKAILFVPGAEYSRVHTLNADMDEIFRKVGENVFSAYTKMPERFVELMQINIADPASCVRAVGRSLDIRKVIGAKQETEFIESLVETINPSVPYTAYDIASLYIEAGTELEWMEEDTDNGGTVRKQRNPDAITKLRNSLSKAVFYKY